MTATVELSPTLHDLLVREAHLRRCREQLQPVWSEKEAELRAVQAARPKFLPVFSKKKREEYEERLAAAREAVGVLRQGMTVIDRLEPIVKKRIEEIVAEDLSAERPEYARALAARRQKEEWELGVARFAEKIEAFIGALGNARVQACSGYGKQANTYSPGALQAFTQAIEAAQAVEEAAKSANKVADAQARMYLTNGFNLRPLPRLPETDYAGWVRKLNSLPLDETQAQFDALLEQTKKLRDSGLTDLHAEAESIDQLQGLGLHQSVHGILERYRAEVAPEIFAGDTERVVAETEEMLLTAAAAAAC